VNTDERAAAEDPFPYANLPPYRLWRAAVCDVDPEARDAQARARFRIDASTAIASAGSCFAERASDRLRADGYRYVVTEPGPAWLSDEQRARRQYGRYSARYGNVYSALHLLQLLQRATGALVPIEDVWEAANGAYLDPFRPFVEPGGFTTPDEVRIDRDQHLAATARAFREADVFLFTLGLTETWCDARDDTALAVCPGNGRGRFRRERYVLRNLDVEENVRYLDAFVTLARTLQPNLRVLLTVSPVPLIATATDDHVIAATTYAKSVLVAAARELRRRYSFVDYFAAYELVVSPAMPQPAFEADGRSVRADAFERVMRSFYRHYSDGAPPARVASAHQAAARQTRDDGARAAQARIDAFEPCDEEAVLAKLTADPTA
jgi:hypothetical protein